jgi:hypothetical protein
MEIQETCKNCGNERHCSIVKVKENYDWRGTHLGQTIICQHCRCNTCEENQSSAMMEIIKGE